MSCNINPLFFKDIRIKPHQRGSVSFVVMIIATLLFFPLTVSASQPNSIPQKELQGNNKNEKTTKSFSGSAAKEGKKDQNAQAAPKILDIYVPATIPTMIHQRNFAIPFSIQTGAEDAPIMIELLYSNDMGKEWRSFGRIQATSPQREFFFRAQNDGEYWFALRTFFKSGQESVSEAQKIKIQTKSERSVIEKTQTSQVQKKSISGSQTDPHKNKVVKKNDRPAKTDDPPLLMLPLPEELSSSAKTKKAPAVSDDSELRKQKLLDMARNSSKGPSGGSDQNTLASQGTFKKVSLDSTLPVSGSIQGEAGNASVSKKDPQKSAKTPSKEEISEDIVFPGKIKSISMGQTQAAEPTILIRWFRPEDAGEKKGKGGSISIERGESANGPWIPIVSNLELNQKGYWWRATQADTIPFHIRTISIDSYGKEWKDVLPQKLDLSSNLQGRLSGSNGSGAGNDRGVVSLSGIKDPLPGVKKDKPNSAISTWQDPPKPPEQSPFMETGLEKELKGRSDQGSGSTGSTLSSSHKTDTKGDPSSGSDYSDLQSYSPSPSPLGLGNVNSRNSVPVPETRYQPTTDPGRFSLNPLFTQGFSAIFRPSDRNSDHVPTRVPPANYSANPYTVGSMNQNPSPSGIQSVPQTGAIRQEASSRRSIFQAPERENPPASPQQPQNGYNNGEINWNSGSTPNAGEVIYLDQNGNRIQNPFPAGSMNPNQVFPVDAQGKIMFHSPMPYQGTGSGSGQIFQNGQPQYQLPEQGMMQGYPVPSASGPSRSGQNIPFQGNSGNRVPLSSGDFMVQ